MLKNQDFLSINPTELSACCLFAKQVALQAGRATLPFFRSDTTADNKLSDGDYDPVTDADRTAEQIIRQAIADTYPDHGIYGEEFGSKEGNGLTWVIDPIDGTRAFVTGMLHWGVLIALFNGQEPILGVMYQPFTEELFWGDNDTAWYQRGELQRKLSVSKCLDLSDSIVATTSPGFSRTQQQRDAFGRVEQRSKLTRYGGDCYLYAMLAMGYIDVALDPTLQPYDIQALIPIIKGAGGVVTTWSGKGAEMGGAVVASANPTLHAQALETLNYQEDQQ